MPAVILITGSAAIVALHAGLFRLTARPAHDFLFLLAATEILVMVWVLAFSRLQAPQRVVALCAFVAAQAALFPLIRLDGFMGDGRPLWSWAWQSAPGSSLDWSTRAPAGNASPPPAVDLTATTDRDYPGFRGADRTGHAIAPPLAKDWKTNPPRLLWKQDIGSGWSSFAIVGDYCLTQEQRGEREATVCYELLTGRERWAHYERARFYEATSGDGPRATPTVHAGRVYALGATGILHCLEGASGKLVWRVDILADNNASNRLFGVTGSPLVAGDMVIVSAGGTGCALAAYDLATGRCVWRGGDAGASYSSPQLAHLAGHDLVLDFNAEGLTAHALATGEVRWHVPWISNPAERNNVCQPVVCAGTNGEPDGVFISSGYGMGCALLAVHWENEVLNVVERWHNRHLKAKFSSVVVHNGFAYGLDDAILTCVEIATGERRWKRGRYGFGQLLLAGDTLLVQLESGEVAMVAASPASFRELGRFPALETRTWNHPALSGRYLLTRNDRQAACYELPLAAEEVK